MQPQLTNQALGVEGDVGLLLPCNVIVSEDSDDTVVALDPAMMVDLTDNAGLEDVAHDARAWLERVVELMAKEGNDS